MKQVVNLFHRFKHILAYAIVIAAMMGALYIVQNNATTRLNQAVYGSCHRVNIGRASDNSNSYEDYQVFSIIIKLSEGSTKSIKTLSAKQRRDRNQFLNIMRADVSRKTWTPLTDCNLAVDHPFAFVPPEPILFRDFVPPQSAFVLGPDN